MSTLCSDPGPSPAHTNKLLLIFQSLAVTICTTSFKIPKFYMHPKLYLYILHVSKKNSEFYPTQHTVFRRQDGKCLLCCMNWVFKERVNRAQFFFSCKQLLLLFLVFIINKDYKQNLSTHLIIEIFTLNFVVVFDMFSIFQKPHLKKKPGPITI
jgi:hypothetical protein